MRTASSETLLVRGAFLVSSAWTICSVVSVNSLSPFLVIHVAKSDPSKVSDIVGTLVFADELLALPLCIFWGYLADRLGYQLVAVCGHLLAGLAFICFANVTNAYPGMLFCRLLFSTGGSALTVTISAVIAALTPNTGKVTPDPILRDASEAAEEREPLVEYASHPPQRLSTGYLAGLVGLASGIGALIAVFVFLRIPATIAHHRYAGQDAETREAALQFGLRVTLYILAIVSLAVCATVKTLLRVPFTKNGNRTSLRAELKKLLLGFVLGRRSAIAALCYISSAAARVQTVAVAQFIPVLVNKYYLSTGKCHLPSPDAPPETVKDECHAAFALASSITGTTQLVALVLSPLVGYIAHRNIRRVPAWILTSGAIGCASFAAMAALSSDPHRISVFLAAIAIGISQAGIVILSLALLGLARRRLIDAEDTQEVAGALAGAASFFGGLAIILISRVGGRLGDLKAGLPFALVAVLDGITVAASSLTIVRMHAV